jgi:redox-sensitive bicupin YhaK (pirin superfamily)
MITPRYAADRGRADHGWLDARHTFSFAGYHDPAHMGFRTVRVLNEDRIAPGGGFGTHPHNDMEIVTWVISGALEHRDSMGNGEVLRAGEVQRMSAGTGITHSEVNASQSEGIHLLQIWIRPERTGIEPSYEQRAVADGELRGRWAVLVAPGAPDDALDIHQDARFLATRLDSGAAATLDLGDRHAWLHVVKGAVDANGTTLSAGDGAAVSGERTLTVTAASEAEVVAIETA